MVNDSKLQLMYFIILFGLSIAQLNKKIILLNQKYLQMQRTRLITMKKREIRRKLVLAVKELHEGLAGLKRLEVIHGGKTSLQIKFWIRIVSYDVKTFVGAKLIRLPTTEGELFSSNVQAVFDYKDCSKK